MRTAMGVVALAAVTAIATTILVWPTVVHEQVASEPPLPIVVSEEQSRQQLNTQVREYLEKKNSPLAADAEFLTELEHWRLIIAISAIESSFCQRQLGYNCWGIGGDSAYRYYSSFRAAAVDANDLITSWQAKGRWHTVEDMNCHYVVPCNPNWVYTVNKILDDLEPFGTTTEMAAPKSEVGSGTGSN